MLYFWRAARKTGLDPLQKAARFNAAYLDTQSRANVLVIVPVNLEYEYVRVGTTERADLQTKLGSARLL